jgi:hypothetical protein
MNLDLAFHQEPCDDSECQMCCMHNEHDHGVCIDCGLDQTEDFAARAYDDAKDARYE